LVRELPEQQRHAVVLYYVEDRSVADVAEILQCSEGSVKTHLSRARTALARTLGHPEEEGTS
jgi:RNA polymerase sigma-70 factor (ECF subfamily)